MIVPDRWFSLNCFTGQFSLGRQLLGAGAAWKLLVGMEIEVRDGCHQESFSQRRRGRKEMPLGQFSRHSVSSLDSRG
jgi:hypothetical protein